MSPEQATAFSVTIIALTQILKICIKLQDRRRNVESSVPFVDARPSQQSVDALASKRAKTQELWPRPFLPPPINDRPTLEMNPLDALKMAASSTQRTRDIPGHVDSAVESATISDLRRQIEDTQIKLAKLERFIGDFHPSSSAWTAMDVAFVDRVRTEIQELNRGNPHS